MLLETRGKKENKIIRAKDTLGIITKEKQSLKHPSLVKFIYLDVLSYSIPFGTTELFLFAIPANKVQVFRFVQGPRAPLGD